MELARLAAKQKKVQNILKMITEYSPPANLVEEVRQLSTSYETVIQRSIESGGVSDPDISTMRDIERQLDNLSEQMRLRGER